MKFECDGINRSLVPCQLWRVCVCVVTGSQFSKLKVTMPYSLVTIRSVWNVRPQSLLCREKKPCFQNRSYLILESSLSYSDLAYNFKVNISLIIQREPPLPNITNAIFNNTEGKIPTPPHNHHITKTTFVVLLRKLLKNL